MQKNVENKGKYKTDIYQEFISWSASPTFERNQSGITTQTEFAAHYEININTLTRWKNQPSFDLEVANLRMQWGRSKTPNVLEGIYRSAVKGNPKSQKLWLDYFTDFKKGVKPAQPLVEMTEEDIRSIIADMPEWSRSKHYSAISRIIEDGVFFRDHPETTEEEYNEINKDGL